MDTQRISEDELADYRADVKNEIFRQIRKRFNALQAKHKFTQKHLAIRLGAEESAISRRLRGENDMRLETFSDLARALDCRIDVTLTPLGVSPVAVAAPYRAPFGGATGTSVSWSGSEPAAAPPTLKSTPAHAG